MDNYKQKYERLTKSIKDLYPYMLADCKKKVEGIILELEMGEDENIRKDLIDFLKSPFVNENITDEKVTPWIAWLKKQDNKNIYTKQELLDMGFSFTLNGDIVTPDEMMEDMKKYLAWKEKQSEKTPSDKVEPKFKVGDWIVSNTNNIYSILHVIGDEYRLLHNINDSVICAKIETINKKYHLWTIQNAKDGDVLANEDMVLIFKHFDEPSYRQHITAHIGLDTCGHIQITNESWNLGLNGAHPATKKQRDLLFQKMREAGYEWDAEKKELKIIEQKNIEGTFINVDDVRENFVKEVYRVLADDTTNDKANDIIYYFDSLPTIYLHTNKPLAPDGDDFDMDDILKNHVWSEEDELQMQGIIDLLSGLSNRHNWLKSLKERVQSQNFTVTDEELAQAKKDAYNNALDKIEYHSDELTFDDGWSAAIDFFQKKSLRPCCAKLLEKQGEQKLADKAESKFKAGDFITNGRRVFLVLANKEERNLGETYSTYCEGLLLDVYGNVLVDGKDFSSFKLATDIERVNFAHDLKFGTRINYKPADLPNGEDYDIDSLGHAIQILEKTIGQVDGYRISEHKRAIEAVTRVYKRKSNNV